MPESLLKKKIENWYKEVRTVKKCALKKEQ